MSPSDVNGFFAISYIRNIKNLLLPRTSESEAAGKLTKIPGMVDAAATMPIRSVGVWKLFAKGFRTGLLDIVELSIAKRPITHSVQNMLLEALDGNVIMKNQRRHQYFSLFCQLPLEKLSTFVSA